jgi:hypothetical protein
MDIPTYTLQDLQQIEREAAAHLSAMFEMDITVIGPGADHPRCGFDGTDIGGAREVTAHIGDDHINDTYYAQNAAAYEWEQRGSYGLYLANELRWRWERSHGAPVTAIEIEDAEDEHVHVEEMTL